jgi:hypothetical protein
MPHTIARIASDVAETPGQRVVHPIETPIQPSGGLTILKGSLAAEGCVVKLAGHERRHHRGPARVFDSEVDCFAAVRDNRILAFTRPGSRSIYLCGDQFSHAAFINLEYAANILIHEGLHCLGLGEDPPSSKSITALVAADCPVPSEKPRIRPVGQDEGSGGRVP